MGDMRSLDVVIPSFNDNPTSLRSILQMTIPEGVNVRFCIILDNPEIEGLAFLSDEQKHDNVTVIRNESNLGAHKSRNIGIEAGTGEWILFLDDDVEAPVDLLTRYVERVRTDEDDPPGYVGVTRFPKPLNRFTNAVVDSDILTFFPLAESRKTMWWGVTANLLVRREALGDFRFSEKFPKCGGGEDIDVCLLICNDWGSPFSTAPEAEVHHPWWFEGERRLKRFARWAFGDSRLPSLHPQHRYRNWPNIVETLFLATITGIIAYFVGLIPLVSIPVLLAYIFTFEMIGEWIKLNYQGKKSSLWIAIEVVRVRGANDLGRFIGNLSRGRLWGICERFDYFCTRESIRFERGVALGKFVLHIAGALAGVMFVEVLCSI